MAGCHRARWRVERSACSRCATERAEDPDAIKAYLGRFAWQGIHRIQEETAARIQRRAADRLAENDAWQAAVAKCMKAKLLGHDDAFERLGGAYEDHWPA
jgi:predicted nucleic acid-binding protein